VVLVAVAALAAVLGGSSPSAAAPDLRSLLADAPGFSWREASRDNPNVIEGPFTATSYADFVASSSGSGGSTLSALNDDGFNGGYGREWRQLGSHDLLIERVFQFDSASGASSFYADIKSNTESRATYQGTIPAASTIPNSFGAILKDPKFPTQWRVDFHKDNRIFVVHTDSDTSDLASLAVSQAEKEYNPGTSAGQQAPPWLKPVLYGVAVVLVIFLAGLVTLVLLVSRRRPAAAAAAPIQMSPDGAYWWDGARWRSTAADPPPGLRPPGS
jgi:hypothetical protein